MKKNIVYISIMVAFLWGCSASHYIDLSKWDSNSENVTRMELFEESEFAESYPDYLPGKGVIFESYRTDNSDIWLKEIGSSKSVTQLTTYNKADRCPSAHPNGKNYIFLSSRAGENKPYYYMGEIGKPTAISLVSVSKPSIGGWRPARVSPDGTLLLYTSGSYIWTYNLKNQQKMQLLEGYSPIWSRDGKSIYFMKKSSDFGRYVSFSIWKSNSDGTGLTEIIRGGDEATVGYPSISLDGKRICYNRKVINNGAAGDYGNSDIWIANIDGTSVTQLTTNPLSDTEPCWIDNNRIIFSSNRPPSGKFEDRKFNLWILSIE